MRRYKTMVTDSAVMTDMIPAPKNRIVTNTCERLNGIVLKDKDIVTQLGR
jgi:hypothetical protein